MADVVTLYRGMYIPANGNGNIVKLRELLNSLINSSGILTYRPNLWKKVANCKQVSQLIKGHRGLDYYEKVNMGEGTPFISFSTYRKIAEQFIGHARNNLYKGKGNKDGLEILLVVDIPQELVKGLGTYEELMQYDGAPLNQLISYFKALKIGNSKIGEVTWIDEKVPLILLKEIYVRIDGDSPSLEERIVNELGREFSNYFSFEIVNWNGKKAIRIRNKTYFRPEVLYGFENPTMK